MTTHGRSDELLTAVSDEDDHDSLDDHDETQGCCLCCVCTGDECFRTCSRICYSISWFTLLFCPWVVFNQVEEVSLVFRTVLIFIVSCAIVALWKTSNSDPGYTNRNLDKEDWLLKSSEVARRVRNRLITRRDAALQKCREEAVGREAVEPEALDNVAIGRDSRSVMSEKEIAWRVKAAVHAFRRKLRYCEFCASYKPETVHHCRTCGRCIARMDHHCPWVNNCVGRDNYRWFLLFLMHVFISSAMTFCLLVYRTYLNFTTRGEAVIENFDGWKVFLCTSTAILCIFFALFVTTMSCEQIDLLTTGITGIDALQARGDDEELTIFQGLKKYACNGRQFSWRWFIPVNLPKGKPKHHAE